MQQYLQNIFYETSLVDAIRNNDVNAGRASIASTLVDLDNRRLIDDVNPLNNFQHLIEECLAPLYQFQWLKTIPIDFQLQQNIMFMVAYFDKRLF